MPTDHNEGEPLMAQIASDFGMTMAELQEEADEN